jgi:hypothetical protein
MIKAIGYNRFIIIGALILIGTGLFFYNANVLQPTMQKQQANLSTVRSKSSEISNNLDKLKNQLSNFGNEKADFARVRYLGFFDTQDRVNTRKLISRIQKDSRLISARYTIKPAESVTNEKLKEASSKILKTDIAFDLEAVEDTDIYRFVYLLSYGFPGQISVKDISLVRGREVTQPLLRQIGSGQAEAIVSAKLNVVWQTMVPDESAQESDGKQRGGRR